MDALKARNLVNINEIAANQAQIVKRTTAPQFTPVAAAQSTNSVFNRDRLEMGSVASPYQLYTPWHAARAGFENWNLSDHYPVPPEEVSRLISDITQTIKDANLSHLSNTEQYEWIENKYAETFGKDFMMAYSLELGNGCSDAAAYRSIGMNFYDTVSSHFGQDSYQAINRERLYSGMSLSEVQNAIRAKYPSNHRLTNRDLLLMVEELHAVGASGIMRGFMSNYSMEAAAEFNADGSQTEESYQRPDSKWTKMLENRADLSILNGFYNMAEMAIGPGMGSETRDFLVNVLGATLTREGLLEPSFVELVHVLEVKVAYGSTPDLLEIFLEDLDRRLRSDESQAGQDSESGKKTRSSPTITGDEEQAGSLQWSRVPPERRNTGGGIHRYQWK